MMVVDPYAWAVMRVGSGLCVAGCYTVIEAWLQAKVTNTTRGRTMGVYRVADMGANLMAQLLISVLSPAAYVSYNLLALLCCAALVPLSFDHGAPARDTGRAAAAPAPGARMLAAGGDGGDRGGTLKRLVPDGGPRLWPRGGAAVDQIATFLAAFVLGGALAQYPVGWLADKFDRRKVLVGLSLAAVSSCLVTAFSADARNGGHPADRRVLRGHDVPGLLGLGRARPRFRGDAQRVELSAALMFFFALGAIGAPLLASALIDLYGPPAMFLMIAVGHVMLAAYGLSRMRARPTRRERTRYVWTPRTSFTIGA